MTARRLLALLALPACTVALACGSDENGGSDADAGGASGQGIQRNAANAKTTIRVGSKNFTEQQVLGEIYAQGLEAAGYRVEKQLNLGNERAAQRSLRGGVIDGYPEYTGTALLSLCDVPADQVPKDAEEAYRDARRCFRRDGLTAYPPTPFTSSNEVGVSQQVAQDQQLQQISDLKRVDQDFTLYGATECRERTDCLLGLQETYGLRFKQFVTVPIGERHEVLRKGAGVASIVFTTDPQIKRQGIVLLEDDKGMFPPNNSTFVVRDEIVEQAGPDLPKVLDQLQRGLTDEVMQELNARVDLDRETPEAVAAAYLREAALVDEG